MTLTQANLADRLGDMTLTRAQVLRAVVQSQEVSAAEFNGAFVAMQYNGYLRRTPEESGYNAWLNYLNATPTDFRTMVHGFMNSQEYMLRRHDPSARGAIRLRFSTFHFGTFDTPHRGGLSCVC